MAVLRVTVTLALLATAVLALPTESITRHTRQNGPIRKQPIKRQATTTEAIRRETEPTEIEPRPIGIVNEAVISQLANNDTKLNLSETDPTTVTSAASTTESVAPLKNESAQRKVITYILGQPAKGTVQSPAELLSPDRYEFYTFDDDGKIIKQLMNVEEIQKIIASSRGGLPADTQHTGDYYQVLTVTPDVESIPAVQLNPHEPLFSIHDVIASVQNVLKNEINQKTTQPPPALVIDGFQNAILIPEDQDPTNLPPLKKNETLMLEALKVEEKTAGSLNATDDSQSVPPEKVTLLPDVPKTEFTIVVLNQTTVKPEVTTIQTSIQTDATTKLPTTTETSPKTVSSVTKTPILIVTKKTAVTTTKAPTTTKKETIVSNAPLAELKKAPIKVTEPSTGEPMMVQIVTVTSSVSQSSSPASRLPTVTTPRVVTTTGVPTTTTTTTTSPSPKPTEKTTFGPIVVTELKTNGPEVPPSESTTQINDFSHMVLPEEIPLSLLDAHPGFVSNETFEESSGFSDSLFNIESQLFDNITTFQNASDIKQIGNYTAAESALNEVQIPMNQDLAESVSSVLSQIANEISLNSLNYDPNFETTTFPGTTGINADTEVSITTTEESETTILPVSWLKIAEDVTIDESTSEISTTTDDLTSEVTTILTPTTIPFMPQNEPRPFSKPSSVGAPETTTEAQDVDHSTPVAESESRTEQETVLPDIDGTTITTTSQEETTTVRAEKTTTTVQYEKKNDPANRLQVIENNGNSSSSIEIIQEAETGRIPRPTQRPEEITTRPGSSQVTTTDPPKSTNKGNTITISPTSPSPSSAKDSTTPPIITSSTTLLSTAASTTTAKAISTTTTESTIAVSSEQLSITEPTNSIEETTTPETEPDDDAENISISFLPMVIRTSTTAPEVDATKEELSLAKTSDDIKLPEEAIESKIVKEEIIEKSAPITSSHKVIIGAIAEEKLVVKKDPPSKVQPQGYVKPTKPVFIKPTKGKPQPLESKPSKPSRPSASEEDQRPYETPLLSSPSALELDQAPDENLGLEATTIHLEPDVRDFVDLCNELAFSLWSSITHNGLSFVRSVVVSPFAVTSLLAMVFLGARGPTSGQMNDILKLDDVVTFNPHLVFRNVTESLVIARHPGVATAAFVRELYSERSKGKLLEFYKERAQQFYDGQVEEVSFKSIGETLRRQTNHLVKRQTWGKVKDFLQGSTLLLRPPLAAFSANIFQADCGRASVKERDGEMYFVVLPSNRLRRLVPIPAAVWRDDFLAGYEPNLDATAVAMGSVGGIVSTIFVMPGQQGLIAPGDSLARLEHHLLGSSYKRGHWDRLMRSLLRRPGLEIQVPRFTHKSVVNVTASLQKMGLRDLFSAEKADLTGLNGLSNDLHLSDMVQVNQFSTCGDDASSSQSHSEYYPATPQQRRDKSVDNIFAESIESLFAVSDFEDPSISALPLELRPRQARIPSGRAEGRAPDPPRLRLDRPFLFFVRHNPTGLILHMGRFNPRLMH